ncbi:MAG: hypothetical protein RR322_01815 [Oscillospiraceae bacterium]
MKTLKLKNAKLENITPEKVSFIGEIKGYVCRLSYNLNELGYSQMKEVDINAIYNIWKYEDTGDLRLKAQNR